MSQKIYTSRLIYLLLGLASESSLAAIAFEDVTKQAGIRYEGLSYGAAWGDFNGDGLPDLWTGNHFNAPSLYLNLGNRTFRDVAPDLVNGDPKADKHGAAWADFDNDGDQDLIQLVGAVAGKGEGFNQLLVNDGGRRLHDEAKRLGVDNPLGRGRTPLWLDADGDGRLDLLITNASRPDGRGPSELFLQSEAGFRSGNAEMGLSLDVSKWNTVKDLLSNLRQLRFRRPHYLSANDTFAQLASVGAQSRLDLLAYTWKTRVYAIGQKPFVDHTWQFAPTLPSGITDAAIDDFTGDGLADLFVSHSNEWPQWGQPHAREIWLSCAGQSAQKTVELNLRAGGNLSFEVQPFDTDRGSIFIGSTLQHPDSLEFSLAPGEIGLTVPAAPSGERMKFLQIARDAEHQQWVVRCSRMGAGVMVRAESAIEVVGESGFEEPEGTVPYSLMTRGQDGFAQKAFPESPVNHSCVSVIAGDFDNDMDLDLYAVCTGPARQEPNVLLENDGKGNFLRVPGGGGAAGGASGRGDVIAAADFDRDGFLDLAVTNGSDLASPLMAPGPSLLFRNLGNANHWVEFDLIGKKSNRDGIGAVVEVESGGIVQRRGQTGGIHRSAQSHQRLHFGLGGNSWADRVTVRWPSGIVQDLKALEGDRIVKIEESVAP